MYLEIWAKVCVFWGNKEISTLIKGGEKKNLTRSFRREKNYGDLFSSNQNPSGKWKKTLRGCPHHLLFFSPPGKKKNIHSKFANPMGCPFLNGRDFHNHGSRIQGSIILSPQKKWAQTMGRVWFFFAKSTARKLRKGRSTDENFGQHP